MGTTSKNLPPSDHEGAGEDGKRHSSNRKKAIIASGLIVSLCLIVGSAWFFKFLPKSFYHHVPSTYAGPVFVNVPEIITNLAGNDGQDSYVKLKVTIEVADVKAAKSISMNMPKFVDMFQAYLRAMHPNELRGSSGTYRLRESLIARARIIAMPVQVKNVLFEELIVQ
jgi:flagellar FliL protein